MPNCVLVKWTDIVSYDGAWMSLDEAKALKPTSMETLGWIILETPEYIVLASTMDQEDDLVGNINAIPRTAIIEILQTPVQPFSEACDVRGSSAPSER